MQRIAELKAQLANLESMERDLDEKDGWGSQVIHICLALFAIWNCSLCGQNMQG